MPTVLVVDDKESLRDSVGFTLQRAGFAVLSAPSGAAAIEIITRRCPDAVVTDLKMPGMTGVELIGKARAIRSELPIVLMTAYGTVQNAVEAMKLGAYDYITKPFEGDELIIAVKRAIEHARLKHENEVLRATAGDAVCGVASGNSRGADASGLTGLQRILGGSAETARMREDVMAVAQSHGTVMIAGESGTGKEVVARAIHEISERREAPFLAVNCAAMSESLLESELFGHEKGAFTGAESLRKGRFELAHGGTLLLDEISEVKPQVQAKLLRVLQERAFERVGSSTTIGIDVRVIATTNRDLEDEVRRGRFRQDLFYRLNVLPLPLPPLRERAGDVAALAPHFVEMASRREGRSPLPITDEAIGLMQRYPWPGNVRELQNLCERAVVLCRDDAIGAELIRLWLTGPGVAPKARASGVIQESSASVASQTPVPSPAPSSGAAPMAGSQIEPRPLADIEREVIIETLNRYNGHRQKTAVALGIGVRTLGLKLKKWKEQQLVAESL